MHQRELTKHVGPMGTSFAWKEHRAVLRKVSTSVYEMREATGEKREQPFVATQGLGAHEVAVSILTEWWGE